MISEMQIHTIARQMIEKHGFEAIAEAARNALACESKGEADEAKEWRLRGQLRNHAEPFLRSGHRSV